MSGPTADWDAKTYDRLAAPHEEWALETLSRLNLGGGETVLDAGCGSGRITRLLLDRLPEGRVIGVDGSASMVAEAAASLAEFGDRFTVSQGNLLDLELTEPVDIVFSNAVFHWISDHERLFARLHDALRPDGRLAVQFGGEGNVANWTAAVNRACAREPFAAHLGDSGEPWYFATAEETEERLLRAGFVDVHCWTEERVVEPEDPRQYVAVVGLAAHHDRLPAELREPFTDAVDAELERPLVLRYVRLNATARRGPVRPV